MFGFDFRILTQPDDFYLVMIKSHLNGILQLCRQALKKKINIQLSKNSVLLKAESTTFLDTL